MKNLKAFFGIAVLVAVIGFSMAACVVGDDGSVTHTHTWGDWQSNSSQHWRVCLICGESSTRADHSGNPCNVCGYLSGGGGNAPTITTSSLPGGTMGTSYSQTLQASGNTPITWSVSSGSLPGGLSLSSGGTISGTPSTAGTSNFSVRATNSYGNDTKALSIAISSGGGGSGTFSTIADFRTWLSSASVNSASSPHYVTLNISDIGGNYYAAGNLGNVLRSSVGTSKYVNITLGGSSLQAISVDAVKNCTTLVGITIPSSVDSIGVTAFQGCTSLTSVNLGSGVKSIGNNAFENCTSLPSITIPASVTSIGNYAFGRCTILNSITISSSITRISIGNYAFDRCTNLESVSLPNGITSIGNYAFTGCTNLGSVTIPGSIVTFGNNAFQNCTNLTSVTVTSGVQTIGPSGFLNCTNLTSVSLPNTLKSIEASAFNGCAALPSITIPGSVTGIGASAFYACNNLTTVTFQSGSNIASASFASYNVFPGDLRAKYLAAAGGAGTYVKAGTVWTKQ